MDDRRRCAANRRDGSGVRCKKAAILGGTVCGSHGGSAPQVRRKAAERLADLIDPDRALRELARLAYSDLTTLYGPDGALLPMSEWPREMRGVVSGVKVMQHNVTSGDGVQESVVEVKAWDKTKALNMLLTHLGLLVERLEIAVDVGAKLDAAREVARRIELARRQPVAGLSPSEACYNGATNGAQNTGERGSPPGTPVARTSRGTDDGRDP